MFLRRVSQRATKLNPSIRAQAQPASTGTSICRSERNILEFPSAAISGRFPFSSGATGPSESRSGSLPFARGQRDSGCRAQPSRSNPAHPLGLRSAWQLIEGNGRLSHCPEIAAFITERILEQQRIRVEHLPLDLFEGQRLRLRKCGVRRAFDSDLSFHSLIFSRALPPSVCSGNGSHDAERRGKQWIESARETAAERCL
jgi:hypothetical protein